MTRPPLLRCAIYTRKSSEEGLEQEFNSLHAQREACEAYIKSQQHEGWRLIKTAYDDGGFSGGNLERPALKALLSDIRSGSIDIVVVYKVDRLTRSLTDFARIVEIFDTHKVSFVSVTQAFNTTSSMGRLTLNVLLSFAQFEREVTGERIRDKIAASKQKGMWMGGFPPLGYDVRERKLVVNEPEAELVRELYWRYLDLKSVRVLAGELKREGIRSKRWTTAGGAVRGGAIFSRGALYTILGNRVYRGEIEHKGKVYPGQHEAIVPEDLWAEVADLLSKQRVRFHTPGRGQGISHLLTGLLFDDMGHPMVPSYTVKPGGRRYRYYASQALIARQREAAGSLSRVAAEAVETVVLEALKRHLPRLVWTALARSESEERWRLLRRSVGRIVLSRASVTIECSEGDHPLIVPISLKARGGETLLVAPADSSERAHPDSTLIRALARAWTWRKALERGDVRSPVELAKAAGCTTRYITRMLALAYLAPDITEAILTGRQPVDLTLARLLQNKIPLAWDGQRALLHGAAA